MGGGTLSGMVLGAELEPMVVPTEPEAQQRLKVVPSEDWLEFAVARSPGNMKVSDQAARLIG